MQSLSKILLFVLLAVSQNLLAQTENTKPFAYGQIIGEVDHKKLDEISGIVASRSYPGIFWVHNDSGDKARVYAINSSGEFVCQLKLVDAEAEDWEDIAIRKVGESWELVLGDIGDNRSRRDSVWIYTVDEPNPFEEEKIKTVEWNRHTFTYEDGPRDAEVLLSDKSGQLYIITKRDSQSRLYLVMPSQKTAKFLFRFPFRMAVGGDFHPETHELLVKTYDEIYYWQYDGDFEGLDSIQFMSLLYKAEKQGEAICWDALAKSFYTVSEGDGKQEIPFLKYIRIGGD